MRAAGLNHAGPIHADGKLHRFKAEGDKARNSWFVLHAGPPAAGAFGCWKRGLKENWHGGKSDLSQAQCQLAILAVIHELRRNRARRAGR